MASAYLRSAVHATVYDMHIRDWRCISASEILSKYISILPRYHASTGSSFPPNCPEHLRCVLENNQLDIGTPRLRLHSQPLLQELTSAIKNPPNHLTILRSFIVVIRQTQAVAERVHKHHRQSQDDISSIA